MRSFSWPFMWKCCILLSGASSPQEKAVRKNANCYLAECSDHPFGTSAQRGMLIIPNIYFSKILYVVSADVLEVVSQVHVILKHIETFYIPGWVRTMSCAGIPPAPTFFLEGPLRIWEHSFNFIFSSLGYKCNIQSNDPKYRLIRFISVVQIMRAVFMCYQSRKRGADAVAGMQAPGGKQVGCCYLLTFHYHYQISSSTWI